MYIYLCNTLFHISEILEQTTQIYLAGVKSLKQLLCRIKMRGMLNFKKDILHIATVHFFFQECCFLFKEYIVSRQLFSFEEITYNVCPLFKTYHTKKTLRGWPNFIKRYIAYFHTFVLQERGSAFSFNNNLFLFQGMLQCSLTTALLDRLETQFFLAHISGSALLVDSGVWTYI